MSRRETPEERGAIAREWLPEELTNRGLRVAADPPSEQAARAAATNGSAPPEAHAAARKSVPAAPKRAPAAPKSAPAPAKPTAPVPEKRRSFSPEEFERAVRDRVAAVESRLESRLKKALDDLRRAERRAAAPPQPAGNGLTEPAPASASPAAAAPEPMPEGTGLGPDVDSRLKAAELRVAEAVRATERRVLEVSQLVGALQAIQPENGSNGAEGSERMAPERRSIRPG
jgi:hypothetical protein